MVRELATVKMAIMIVQKEFGGCKVSLRSKEDMDVSLIAKSFGGGGHKKASGFEYDEFKPEEIIKKIRNEI